MVQQSQLKWAPGVANQAQLNAYSKEDVAVMLASSGYYKCVNNAKCGGNSVQTKTPMNNLLNNAPASFEGVVLKIQKGTYHYMCSRNNNFSNRSQKGSIVVN